MLLKDAFRLWRIVVKVRNAGSAVSKSKGAARLFLELEKITERRMNYCIKTICKSLEANQLEVARADLIKAFNSLQKSVQTVQAKYRMSKSQESENNNAYLENLKGHINSIDELLTAIAKKKAEIQRASGSQDAENKAQRKLISAAKIHKLFLAPTSLDCQLVGRFLKWRFRCISATSKLLTEDIKKCFAKHRKTMFVLLNRRVLNKIIGHFHYFVRCCASLSYRKSPAYTRKLGAKLCKLLIKHKASAKDTQWAFAEWRTFIRRDIRNEYRRKMAVVGIVRMSVTVGRSGEEQSEGGSDHGDRKNEVQGVD